MFVRSVQQRSNTNRLEIGKLNVSRRSPLQQRGGFHTSALSISSTTSNPAIVFHATVTGSRSRRHTHIRVSSEAQQQLLQDSDATVTSSVGFTADGGSTIETTNASSSNTSSSSRSSTAPDKLLRRRKGRPSKQQTTAAATPPTATPSGVGPASPAKRPHGRSNKQRAPLASASAISQQLVAATKIPPAVADKLAAAQLKDSSVSNDFDELKRRVMLILAMFDDNRGATALGNYPRLVCTRPEVLTRHLLSWAAFFDDMPGDPEANKLKLLERIVARPQLLTVNVENLVGNLYEIGTILQAEDLHMFAAKAMKLALMRPEVVQEKMRRVLLLLNSEARLHAPRRTGSVTPTDFDYSDVQKAARRDYRWLMLSTETLEARLLGLQQALQVPLVRVGRVFVLQPSLVNKTTQHITDKFAALATLPGMQPQQAKGAVLAFPALLNLRSEVLKYRWQQLQEAAATSPKWKHELDNTSAGALPTLLIVTNSRYDRLQAVAARRQQASRKMGTLLHMSDRAYQTYAAKYLQHQAQQQQQPGSEDGV